MNIITAFSLLVLALVAMVRLSWDVQKWNFQRKREIDACRASVERAPRPETEVEFLSRQMVFTCLLVGSVGGTVLTLGVWFIVFLCVK